MKLSYLLERLAAPARAELEQLVLEAVGLGHDGQPGAPYELVCDRVFSFMRDPVILTAQVDSMLRRGVLLKGQDGELYVG